MNNRFGNELECSEQEPLIKDEYSEQVFFNYEKLEEYQVAIDFAVVANEIVEVVNRNQKRLAEQLQTRALAIPIQIAATSRVGVSRKRREIRQEIVCLILACAATLEVCKRLRLVGNESLLKAGCGLLQRLDVALNKSRGQRSESR